MKAVICKSVLAASFLLSSQIALSQNEEVTESATPESSSVSEVASAPAAPVAPTMASPSLPSVSEVQSTSEIPAVSELPPKFVSDGSLVHVSEHKVGIYPPKGWEVITNNPTLTLIMQEVKEETAPLAKGQEPKYLYQRNITVAAINNPAIMDEKRALQLEVELMESFGTKSSSSNYQIVEHKFFDYRPEQKGIIVYSAFTLNTVDMMQMHVLVSGAEKQFLLTYTDMASNFSKEEAFNEAWASMASIEVEGVPSPMLNPLLSYGIPAAIVVLLLLALAILRSRSSRNQYSADEFDVYKDEPYSDPVITQTHVWNLKANDNASESSGVSFVTNI